MNCIAIIPARGGSKRVEGKNMALVAGEPMIVWTIRAALEADVQPYVSSDNETILRCADRAGAKLILRPEHLAMDVSTTESVIAHALDVTGERFDSFLLLQPTSPLRTALRIRQARALLELNQWDSVIGVTHDPGAYFLVDVEQDGEAHLRYTKRPRTQEIEGVYRENGSIYGSTYEAWKQSGNRVSGKIAAIRMMDWESVDVDTLDDLAIANYWASRQLFRRNPPLSRDLAITSTMPQPSSTPPNESPEQLSTPSPKSPVDLTMKSKLLRSAIRSPAAIGLAPSIKEWFRRTR